LETIDMASSARIFFAGIGTTFLIIGAGFGGGLMFAKSALHDTPAQTRASSQPIDPVRVILPTPAEASQAPQPSTAVPVQSVPTAESTADAKVPEKQVEKVDTRKAEAEERERKKRYAERKAREIAAARAKQQIEAKQQVEQARAPQPGIMAFGGDEPRPVGLFGN
jgi:hypothetical protein